MRWCNHRRIGPSRPYAYGAAKHLKKKHGLANEVVGPSKIQRFFLTTTAGEDETSLDNPGNSNDDAVDVVPRY